MTLENLQQRAAASQIRAVLSQLVVSTRSPSGENGAVVTKSSWPRSTTSSRPVAASQMRAVLSVDAVTTRLPSGEKRGEHDQSLVAGKNGDGRAGPRVP